MPHVSSRKLDPKVARKVFKKLFEVFEGAQNSHQLYSVMNEIFTDTEKIMLAKRLAIILMLDNRTPQHKITEILKVSPSTVSKISLLVEIGKYNTIINISKKINLILRSLFGSYSLPVASCLRVQEGSIGENILNNFT